MPQYRRYGRRRERYDEYDDYYSRPRRRRSRGCLGRIRRFFFVVFTTILIILGIIVLLVLVLLVLANGKFLLSLLPYALLIAGVFTVLGLFYLLIRFITAISHRISAASVARSKAKLERERARIERERVKQARNQVQLQQSKLAREEYAFYERYEPRSEAYYTSPRRTKVLRETATDVLQERSSQREPEPVTDLETMGMPKKGHIFHYRNYRHLLKPGQLLIGIRANGSARIGTWQDFKIVLILGSSSSGKSTTTLEKCLCMVDGGGQLVICDPGGFKPDSLTQRLGSLREALMPGSMVALEHTDIMKNMELFREELERRRRGAPMIIPLLLVVDELNGILMDRTIKKELTELLEKFGQQARGYNLFMILCAQRSSGLATIRNSVISFIVHKTPSMESSKVLDAHYAKYTPQLGIGQTFVSDANGDIEALQQVLVVEEDLPPESAPLAPVKSKHHTEPMPPRNRQFGAPARPSPQTRLEDSSPAAAVFLRTASQPKTWGDTQPLVSLNPANSPPSSLTSTKLLLERGGAIWMTEETQPHPTVSGGAVLPLETEPLGRSPSSSPPMLPDALDPFEALARQREKTKKKKS